MSAGAARKRLKNRLRSVVRQMRRLYISKFRSFNAEDLAAALRRAGIVDGDQLLLHSSFEEHHGFRGGVVELIDCLVSAVGSAGGIYMVSMPYASSTAEYLRGNPVFDLRRTPSRMGLVSEFFRRRSGVIRSRHPTHPVLGIGVHAREVLAGHEAAEYSCGPGSPFERLLHRDGKLAFMNVSMDTMTYFHYLEHLIAASLPFPLYEPEPMEARMRDEAGSEEVLKTWVFSMEAIRRRRPPILQDWMEGAGLIKTVKVGATCIRVMSLRAVTDLVLERAARGEFFYDMAQ
jgi:aminoglycoside 3-N-acetyltransferase